MSETLPIDLNRDGLHDVDVPASFEADGSFAVALENHGAPVHVHLRLDDELGEVAELEASNHYVEEGSTRSVGVELHGGLPASGRLKVVTGYGAESAYVDVNVVEPDERSDAIPVDDDLTTPRRPTTERDDDPGELRRNLPLVALGVAALALAATAGLLVDGLAALFGTLVVLVGVGVAAYFLLE
ncbi:hypothetical protein DMJ13_14450 [halophilic archaeon]|nr:hypothetical protein DMJ13_14450 [halophilic archaeon]